MKPGDIKTNLYILSLEKKLIIKILNLNLVILLENQRTKTFLQKFNLQIGQMKFL